MRVPESGGGLVGAVGSGAGRRRKGGTESLIEEDSVSVAGRFGQRGNGNPPASSGFVLAATREDQPYVSRLATRAAFYAELQALLAAVKGAVPRVEYRRHVIEDNVLSRPTTAAREKTWKELAARYGIDGASPLFRVFLEEYRRASSENDRALTAYLLFALHDRLASDLGTEWLYQYLRAAPAELRTADVLAFLRSRARNHPEIAGWSTSSRENIASHYLSALREFGLARRAQRKASVRPAPGAAPVRFLLLALQLSGVSNLTAVQSPLFRLLGLSLDETVDLLFRLSANGSLRCRIQGDVVDLDLRDPNGS